MRLRDNRLGAMLLLFLCALTAGADAPPRAGARGSASEQPWRLCCRITNYGSYQDVAWQHLQSLGIRYAFVFIPEADQVEAMQKRLTEHRLEALVVRGVLDLSSPTSVDATEGQFQICRKIGCRYMFVSPKHPGVSKEDACQRLRRAGEIARRYGVTITLETHPDLGASAAAHLETMKRVNHPNVRVNFDTGNIHYYNRGASAVEELKQIIDYVATVEIKDHNGTFEDWNFPALGQGVVDIPGVLRVLKEHKFDGPITMEIEGIKGMPWSREQTLKAIADSTAYLRSLASFR